MLQTAISKPLLQKAAADLQREWSFSLFQHVIQKGRELSRQGLVYNVTVIDSDFIEGKVIDTAIHDVTLDLSDISLHSCTCGTEDLCPHVLALFFYVYGNVFDNGELLRQWKQGKKKPNRKAASVQTPSEPNTAESVAQWRKQFADLLDEWSARHRRRNDWPYRLSHQLFPRLVKNSPKHSAVRLLHRFHAALFLLDHLFEYGRERGWDRGLLFGSYEQFSWQQDVDYIADEWFETLERFPSELLPPSVETHIEQTIPYVRELLLRWGKASPSLVYSLYTTAWELLFTKEAQRRQEKETLIRLATEKQSTTLLLAAAHLAFLLGEDDEALAIYRQHPKEAAPFFIDWMERFASSHSPERFASFWAKGKQELAFYISALPEMERSPFVNEIGRLYESYARQHNKWEDYEKLLAACFPYSANRYVHWLLDQRRYHDVVDLYLWGDATAHDIDPTFLAMLQKQNPALVLPLYHRAVMRFVEAKNRASYRVAVQYLKKLRACYRSLKRMNEWQMYLEQLLAKTARMRAFHEEVEKGKLLL
ncbi:SWIM zinc finger family protein [Geobacillus stearothermophilus]|uniref:SWIM zinc finger family protein n=1 Tax=Geobacillus stearothermophilus TaxID=1422 RepID=UPI002E1A9F7A|nr:SWIM zinc finger family protein [Geobacillus stearothermophilus]